MRPPGRARMGATNTASGGVGATRWEGRWRSRTARVFPAAAVARDQLQYAVAELSTHDNQRVTKALNDGLHAALTGAKPPAQAMKDAQREAERILRPYRRYRDEPRPSGRALAYSRSRGALAAPRGRA